MIKLIDNSFRDMNFSFSNEIALLCEKSNVDSYEAIKAANFELTHQNTKGYFPGGMVGKLTGASVFNTAQVIDGLVRAHKETGEQKYLNSAIKAANWIISVQENDGSWGMYNYLGMKRVYDSKVCEALLKTGKVSDSNQYLNAVKLFQKYRLEYLLDPSG